MYKKNLIIKPLLMVILLFASLFVINASSIPITDGGGTTPCSSLGQTDCLARTDCCWSDYWQICRGTGEKCCHDVACSRGSSFCNQCPNDALDYYQCQGNNIWSTNIYVGITDCVGKLIGDVCGSQPAPGVSYECGKDCKCTATSTPTHCVESFGYSGYEGLRTYCSLPGDVCQQGDTIGGLLKVVTLPCPTTPVIQVSITGSGCSITDSFNAGRYYASGPGWWYEYSWTFPQLPSTCLGKTVTLTLTSQGESTSKTIKLSSDPTRDNPPSLPRVGVWSPSPILPSDLITYTAHAEDDKGLSQIQILFANYKVSTQYGVVKTCPVSGTSADCIYTTPTSFSAGSEICIIGNAFDIKNQQNTGYDMGARKDRNCITVCNFPIDTDNDKNYYVKGNCTSPCSISQSDFCPWEGPKGYCCNLLGDSWVPKSVSADGTVECCYTTSLFNSTCDQTKIINCKNLLGEYFVNGRSCSLGFYDCSGEGKICQNGACVATGCTPTTCSALGKQCGSLSDGCGGTLNCGSCTSPQTCVNGVCQGGSAVCGNGQCESGETQSNCCRDCGCPSGQNCNITSDTCYTPSGSIQISLKPGWNMFSVPVNTTLNVNDIKTQCGTTNPIWRYNSSSSLYESAAQVQPGYGYWLKVSNNCYIQVSGNNIERLPELKTGWNQVGAFSQSVNFNDVKGNCNVLGGPWKYSPVTLRYELASILDPGYGYWMRVSSNCNLNTGGSPPPTP